MAAQTQIDARVDGQVAARAQQLALNSRWMAAARRARHGASHDASHDAPMCAGCRAREARYGFSQDGHDAAAERPRTLCFDCFRVELGRRQTAREWAARGWNGRQVTLPLEHTLEHLRRRRGRAQIAARRVLGLNA